ncbi:MAG: bifunctional aspartate kinase/homoserine dehydrogenase I, partial [Flavobacteriaceae bacterium]
MKVLKFGGTSVASPESITHVIDIIKQTNDRQWVVVSALGGITNLLIEMAELSSSGKSNFKSHLKTIETRHLNLIEHFIPVTQQSASISYLKSQLNELEEILESLYTLKELTEKSLAKISSYGEVLSSTIISKIFQYQDLSVELKDSRELLFTKNINEREVVDHELSREKTLAFLEGSKSSILLVPGFIATDHEG